MKFAISRIDSELKTRLLINLSLWIFFAAGRLILQINMPEKIKTYTELIDIKTILVLLGAAAIVFLFCGVINRRTSSNETFEESATAMDIVLAEISSVLMNLGGLTIAVGILEAGRIYPLKIDWYFIGIGLVLYCFAYFFLIPKKKI